MLQQRRQFANPSLLIALLDEKETPPDNQELIQLIFHKQAKLFFL